MVLAHQHLVVESPSASTPSQMLPKGLQGRLPLKVLKSFYTCIESVPQPWLVGGQHQEVLPSPAEGGV